jgi:hypothetical protein
MLPEPDPTIRADDPLQISRSEASYWWRTNSVAGAILYRMMILFIFTPMALVYYRYYVLSFIVFAFIVPYGLLLQYLAERFVARIIRKHPETIEHFESEGIVVR